MKWGRIVLVLRCKVDQSVERPPRNRFLTLARVRPVPGFFDAGPRFIVEIDGPLIDLEPYQSPAIQVLRLKFHGIDGNLPLDVPPSPKAQQRGGGGGAQPVFARRVASSPRGRPSARPSRGRRPSASRRNRRAPGLARTGEALRESLFPGRRSGGPLQPPLCRHKVSGSGCRPQFGRGRLRTRSDPRLGPYWHNIAT